MQTRWMLMLGLASLAATAYATTLLVAPVPVRGADDATPPSSTSARRDAPGPRGPAARPLDAAAGPRREAPPPSAAPRLSPHANARARIEQEFDESARLAIEGGRVGEYLDGLARRAEAKGQVSALEVEPGLLALRAADAKPEEIEAFGRRMAELSARLRGDDASSAPPPAPMAHEVD